MERQIAHAPATLLHVRRREGQAPPYVQLHFTGALDGDAIHPMFRAAPLRAACQSVDRRCTYSLTACPPGQAQGLEMQHTVLVC